MEASREMADNIIPTIAMFWPLLFWVMLIIPRIRPIAENTPNPTIVSLFHSASSNKESALRIPNTNDTMAIQGDLGLAGAAIYCFAPHWGHVGAVSWISLAQPRQKTIAIMFSSCNPKRFKLSNYIVIGIKQPQPDRLHNDGHLRRGDADRTCKLIERAEVQWKENIRYWINFLIYQNIIDSKNHN